jgi:serine/threonine protein kinase
MTYQHVKNNLKLVLAYLCGNQAGKRILSPEEALARVRCVSDFVRQKISDRPDLENDYRRRHWIFCDAIRKSRALSVFQLIMPEDLGLVPYFSNRERVLVSGKQKPLVNLGGVPCLLSATRTLGLGSFGVVKDAVLGSQSVAIKRSVIGTLSYDLDALLDAVGEAQCLLELQHANIVRCFGFFMYGDGKAPKSDDGGRLSGDANVTKFATVLERVRPMHPSLLAKLSTDDVVTFFRGLAEGLAFLHQEGLVHGDFKTINSGMGLDGIPKLLDFGFCESTTVRDVSALRCAPEQLGGTYPSPEAIAQRAAYLIKPCDGKKGRLFLVKNFSDDPAFQTTKPPYGYVSIPHFSTIDLTKLDVFAFGVSFYDAIKVHFSHGNDDAWPSYMTCHRNLNFLRDNVIMNGKHTYWTPNPVFEFIDTAILFSDSYSLLSPESSWLFDVVKGCLSEDAADRWPMKRVMAELGPRFGKHLSAPVASSAEIDVIPLSAVPSLPSDELVPESPWSIISAGLSDSEDWDLCDT